MHNNKLRQIISSSSFQGKWVFMWSMYNFITALSVDCSYLWPAACPCPKEIWECCVCNAKPSSSWQITCHHGVMNIQPNTPPLTSILGFWCTNLVTFGHGVQFTYLPFNLYLNSDNDFFRELENTSWYLLDDFY